jgi:hypothetical protein
MSKHRRRDSWSKAYVLCIQVVGLLTALATLAAALLQLL